MRASTEIKNKMMTEPEIYMYEVQVRNLVIGPQERENTDDSVCMYRNVPKPPSCII